MKARKLWLQGAVAWSSSRHGDLVTARATFESGRVPNPVALAMLKMQKE